MSKNHNVGSTSHTTTTRTNAWRAQSKKGNHTEKGIHAKVNGSISLDHDPDERPTTGPNDSTLPNGHSPDVFGSTSHECGMNYQGEGHFPRCLTANGGSSATPALWTRSTDLDRGTNGMTTTTSWKLDILMEDSTGRIL